MLGPMLTEEQTATLQRKLEGERVRLVENAKRAIGFTMDRDRDRIGRDSLDESTEESMYSTELRLADRENFLLNKITSALERIKAGEIDECEDCGDPIGYQRLLARPVTTLCISCKEDAEQRGG